MAPQGSSSTGPEPPGDGGRPRPEHDQVQVMTGLGLAKLFAWVIGVLSLLWMLAECLGGPNVGGQVEDSRNGRGAEQFAADCERTWEALDALGEVDHENVGDVVDRIEMLAAEISDPELSEITFSFGTRAEELVAGSGPEEAEQIEENYRFFRGMVMIDLSMRCGGASMSVD